MKYDRIKNLREDNDKTQQEVADALGLTRSAYSNYENGLRNAPIEVLYQIADYYQVSLDYLTGRTDDKKPSPSETKNS